MGCDCAVCQDAANSRGEGYQQMILGLRLIGVAMPEQPISLGSGAYATVWATDDNRVVKLTSDKSERFTALLAMRNPQPGLVRVDGVYRLGEQTVILNERLEPLPADVGDQWDNPGWNPSDMIATPDYVPTARDTPARIAAVQRVREAHRAIGRALIAIGVTNANDLHRWNVMVRPSTGEIVMSDLGMTRSTEKPEPAPLPRPGVDDGDGGDVHVDPKPAPKPDPRVVRWDDLPRERAPEGAMFRVAAVDKEKGTISLEVVRNQYGGRAKWSEVQPLINAAVDAAENQERVRRYRNQRDEAERRVQELQAELAKLKAAAPVPAKAKPKARVGMPPWAAEHPAMRRWRHQG